MNPVACHECRKEFLPLGAGHIRCLPCREAFRKVAERARSVVAVWVRQGMLPNLKTYEVACCDCSLRRADHYDHRDYSKPLHIAPVCSGCNRKRGPALPMRAAA